MNKRSGEQTVNWTSNIWTLHYQTGNILNKWHEVNDTVEQLSWLNNRLSEQWTIVNWTSLIEHNLIKHFLNEQIPFEHWTINNWTNLFNWPLFNWLLFNGLLCNSRRKAWPPQWRPTSPACPRIGFRHLAIDQIFHNDKLTLELVSDTWL